MQLPACVNKQASKAMYVHVQFGGLSLLNPASAFAGTAQHAKPHAQSKASPQAALESTSRSKGTASDAGFDDIVVPDESADDVRAADDGAGPSNDHQQGAAPGRAEQDVGEPEATLPGGTATGGSDTGSAQAKNPASASIQKHADPPATFRKRKAKTDDVRASQQPARLPAKRRYRPKCTSD